MKICGIICEYNPFHNGHAYLIDEAKKRSGCDAVVCVMSGNFTQRGEMAVFDKYTRAKHAVLAGADAVLELPAAFALSPAERFALGGVKILASIPTFTSLAFGCEDADPKLFESAAGETTEESEEFRAALRARLNKGLSFARARAEALAKTAGQEISDFLQKPNNILGVEYCKALVKLRSSAASLPILRRGAEHADTEIKEEYSSATAIRAAMRGWRFFEAKASVPPFVYEDMPTYTDDTLFKNFLHFNALTSDAERLALVTDCTEGLENRIKACAQASADCDELIANATTRRYISSRIRRILSAAALGITDELVSSALLSPLYLKPLAVRKDRATAILRELGKSDFPLLTRRNDIKNLSGTAARLYAKDRLASDIYALCSHRPQQDLLLPLV